MSTIYNSKPQGLKEGISSEIMAKLMEEKRVGNGRVNKVWLLWKDIQSIK